MKTNYKVVIFGKNDMETKYINDNTKGADALQDMIDEALDNGAELVAVYDNDSGDFLGEWE